METPRQKAIEIIERFTCFAFDGDGLFKLTDEKKIKIKKIAYNVAEVVKDSNYSNKQHIRFYEDVMEEIHNFDFNFDCQF